ncbi:hypothetical protein [Pseudoalteromonas tunicata]|uniref:Uncharacterized protein n=1 Tax=Pseudoalteromonas tunicata D2 TaxID=87626 RepID=A4CBA5_9GAMM|nr:hypothetical protein [Pseudoalteromonas tunicata]EAR27642.1 hypothetical protein PTD2_17510 [Pseudoalteromonas tunicata D2]
MQHNWLALFQSVAIEPFDRFLALKYLLPRVATRHGALCGKNVVGITGQFAQSNRLAHSKLLSTQKKSMSEAP